MALAQRICLLANFLQRSSAGTLRREKWCPASKCATSRRDLARLAQYCTVRLQPLCSAQGNRKWIYTYVLPPHTTIL